MLKAIGNKLQKHYLNQASRPLPMLLEWYPPLFLQRLKVTDYDYKNHTFIEIELRPTWWASNAHGSMFGGWIASASDPLPALLISRIFPGHEVWTKAVFIDFIKPAKSKIRARVTILPETIDRIRTELTETGKSKPKIHFSFIDQVKGIETARIENTVYIRKKPH